MKSEIVSSKKLAIGVEIGHLYLSNDLNDIVLCTCSSEFELNGVYICSINKQIGSIMKTQNIQHYTHFTGEIKLTQ